MTTTTTTQAHHFTAAGCRNQWAADHNDTECWDAFEAQDRKVSK